MKCYMCLLLDSIRFFSDDKEKPYVIVTDQRYMSPILVWRNHISTASVSGNLIEAIGELNEIARKLYGDAYFLKYSRESDPHFYARVEPASTYGKKD